MKSEFVPPTSVEDLIDPLPQRINKSWCLPGYGGPVYIRTYDTYKSTLTDLDARDEEEDWGRWGLDETRIPTTAEAAEGLHGAYGEVCVGSCVIFVGAVEGSDAPLVWYPQRIVAVEQPKGGWQRVWAIRDLMIDDDAHIDPSDFGTLINYAGELRGDVRRAALEYFQLNVDCPACANRGRVIQYDYQQVPIDPSALVNPNPKGEDDPTYACHCGAAWSIKYGGDVIRKDSFPVL